MGPRFDRRRAASSVEGSRCAVGRERAFSAPEHLTWSIAYYAVPPFVRDGDGNLCPDEAVECSQPAQPHHAPES